MSQTQQGGCRCDQVRFQVATPPLMTSACHCSGCQRMSSSAFSLTTIFSAESFQLTQGAPVIGGLHGAEAQHYFCSHCLTWMFTRPAAMPNIVNIRPTMLDDHARFVPFMETFIKNRLPWALTGAVHSFDEFPPMEAYQGLMEEFQQRPR